VSFERAPSQPLELEVAYSFGFGEEHEALMLAFADGVCELTLFDCGMHAFTKGQDIDPNDVFVQTLREDPNRLDPTEGGRHFTKREEYDTYRELQLAEMQRLEEIRRQHRPNRKERAEAERLRRIQDAQQQYMPPYSGNTGASDDRLVFPDRYANPATSPRRHRRRAGQPRPGQPRPYSEDDM